MQNDEVKWQVQNDPVKGENLNRPPIMCTHVNPEDGGCYDWDLNQKKESFLDME